MVPDAGVLDSLESVHDTIHNTVGNSGPGHMTNAAYSAFDPVFWLLHANIDRMTVLWQALNPDSWVTNNSNPTATFTSDAGAYADEDTPLHPFHRNKAGDFWTSASVRDHTVFEYTYPELVGLSADDTLVGRINRLYGDNAQSQFSWKLGDPLLRPPPGTEYTHNHRRAITWAVRRKAHSTITTSPTSKSRSLDPKAGTRSSSSQVTPIWSTPVHPTTQLHGCATRVSSASLASRAQTAMATDTRATRTPKAMRMALSL